MNEFLIRRKEMYIRRKEDLLNKRKVESTRLENESRFVGLVVQKDIKFQKTSKQELISQIESFGLARDQNNSYDYLTEIPVANLTRDRAAKLLKRSVLVSTVITPTTKSKFNVSPDHFPPSMFMLIPSPSFLTLVCFSIPMVFTLCPVSSV